MDTSVKIFREYLESKWLACAADFQKEWPATALYTVSLHSRPTNDYFAKVQREDGTQYKIGSLKPENRFEKNLREAIELFNLFVEKKILIGILELLPETVSLGMLVTTCAR